MHRLVVLLTASAALLCAQLLYAEPRPFIVGVCTHFQQRKGILDLNLSLIRQAGVMSIRDEVTWGAVEREKDRLAVPEQWTHYVNRALESGITPLLILDYGNRLYDGGGKPLSAEAVEGFARYAEFVARHFKGKVKLYEVWNEWDIGIGNTKPGDAESYVRLLKAVYPRVKAADPEVTVMAGAVTPGGIRKGWLDDMMKGAAGFFDAVSIHTYNYSGQGRARTPEAWLEFVEDAQEIVRKHTAGRDVPLYVTEMGWPTHTGPRSTAPALSAVYLARMYLLGRTLPYLKGIWWYDFQDDGWRTDYNENNFGTVRPDLTPKPSYYALTGVAALAAKAAFVERVKTDDPDLWVLRFEGALALWYARDDAELRVVLQSRTPTGDLQMTEAGRAPVRRGWGSRDWPGNTRAELKPDEIDLAVGPVPLLVTGDLAGVTVSLRK